MAVFVTDIPDFRFSGLYYPQIFQSMTIYRRTYMKELNDEDPNEPTTQLIGAFTAGFHYCNVLLDHVALEAIFSSCRLRSSLGNHLALIGQTLNEAVPASTDLLAKLGNAVAINTAVSGGTLFATVPTADVEEILFELVDDLPITRTDLPTYAWEEDGGVFTDVIDEMNGFDVLDLWGGVPEAGDILWIGHDSALYNAMRMYLFDDGDLFTDENNYVFEYYDGRVDDSVPSLVTNIGTLLRFDLTNLLGTNDRSGAEITVSLLTTGAVETATSQWIGGKNVVDTSFLGQLSPSEIAEDYLVGVKFKEVPDAVLIDHDDGFEIQFELPESQSRRWQKTEVNGVDAFWFRLRVVRDTTNSPVFDDGVDITVGTQWLKFEIVQGETYEDDPVGTFDGTINQEFESTQENVIEGSDQLYVDEGGGEIEYTRVDDFLSSGPSALHYTKSFDEDGRLKVRVGDGSAGYLPPIGATARLQYRIGAETDGNVGPEEITVPKSGPTFVTSVTNPRPATGWAPPEGSTEESILDVKVSAPASLRIQEKALTTDDIEELAKEYIFENGSQLVARAVAIPNGFGDKTVKLLVVGQGGIHLTDDQLGELNLAFNGDDVAGVPGMLVAGLELIAVNYVRNVIDVSMTVEGGVKEDIETVIASYLLPTAQKPDGSWEHEFLDLVYKLNLAAKVINSDPDIETVTVFTVPVDNVQLLANELPYPGTISVTVVPV